MGRQSRCLRLAGLVMLAAATIVGAAPPAAAACHSFVVEVEPATVVEGAEVTVTVRRDAGVGPSQIDVETVDGTAGGGADYEPVARRTLSFSSETEQSFPVPTIDDAEGEQAETFSLHLSNPGGCAVNPNFVVGPDAVVTVSDNDAAQTTTTAPATTATTTRASTTTVADDTSTTAATVGDDASTSTTRPTSTTLDADEAAVAPTSDDDDGNSPAVVVVLAVLVVLVAAGLVAWTWRRRRA